MKTPPSEFFEPIPLPFNLDRQTLSGDLRPIEDAALSFGRQSFQGIPY